MIFQLSIVNCGWFIVDSEMTLLLTVRTFYVCCFSVVLKFRL